MDYDFPLTNCRFGGMNYVTSYNLSIIQNDVAVKCGKYIIKRRSFTKDVYRISVDLQDLLSADAATIKTFYEQFSKSKYFDLTLDGDVYDVKFTSFKIDYSTLHNRKNISFSVNGERVLVNPTPVPEGVLVAPVVDNILLEDGNVLTTESGDNIQRDM